ncbi:hypothetical protein BURMUCGD1_0206 [Burkholderia multivorans CGD1]|nr:hypothetical protein BURMUCGD1_0206 [Burkholderia multivorans CGD1]
MAQAERSGDRHAYGASPVTWRGPSGPALLVCAWPAQGQAATHEV